MTRLIGMDEDRQEELVRQRSRLEGLFPKVIVSVPSAGLLRGATSADVVLVKWSVREDSDGDLHLVGFDQLAANGRVSSTVVEFDPASARFRTERGKIYKVNGPPGIALDSECVWGVWLQGYQLQEARDVTREFMGTFDVRWEQHGQRQRTT